MAPLTDSSSEYDLVVVGAGPGGSMAARVAAEGGLSVLLLEKKSKPGRKLCAGGIIGRVMRRFDIDEDSLECKIDSYKVFVGKEGWVDIPAKGAATSYRTTLENESFKRFDYYLAMRARDSGATLQTSSQLVDMRRDNGKIRSRVRTPKGDMTVTSKLVIGSDGFHSTVGRLTGLSPPPPSDKMIVAVQREVITGKNDDCNCYHLFDPSIISTGYLWAYPKSQGFSIGMGCLASQINDPLKFALQKAMTQNQFIKTLIPSGSTILPLEGAPIPAAPLKNFVSDGVMLVGDSAGQCDPISGDGIYYAMAAGKLAAGVAADAVSADDYSRTKLSALKELWMASEGKELAWERRRLEIISKDYLTHFEKVMRRRKSPSKERFARRADYYLSRMTRMMPSFVLEKLVREGYIL